MFYFYDPTVLSESQYYIQSLFFPLIGRLHNFQKIIVSAFSALVLPVSRNLFRNKYF